MILRCPSLADTMVLVLVLDVLVLEYDFSRTRTRESPYLPSSGEVALTHIVFILLSISFSVSYIAFLPLGYLNRYVHGGIQKRRRDCFFLNTENKDRVRSYTH